jgi:cytochrome c biogenesis protein CcmG, thiol:disulfide interchange protein DsbE
MPDTSAGNVTDPGLNKKPPELSGQTFDGSTISIVPGGKQKLVIFVAHWCPHCRAEVPRIVQWMASTQKPANLDIVAVSTAVSREPVNYPPSAWFQREKFSVPVLTDDKANTAANAWGLPGYPYLVMVRADGTVAARTSGELDPAGLAAWIQKAYTA